MGLPELFDKQLQDEKFADLIAERVIQKLIDQKFIQQKESEKNVKQ